VLYVPLEIGVVILPLFGTPIKVEVKFMGEFVGALLSPLSIYPFPITIVSVVLTQFPNSPIPFPGIVGTHLYKLALFEKVEIFVELNPATGLDQST
jgi:hypothetical protein